MAVGLEVQMQLAFEQGNRHARIEHDDAGPEAKSGMCLAQSYRTFQHPDSCASSASVCCLPLLLVVSAQHSFGRRREKRVQLKTDHREIPVKIACISAGKKAR
jgi:hypothetical protein